MFFFKKFPLVDGIDQAEDAVVLEHLCADLYCLKIKKSDRTFPIENWVGKVALALAEANLRHAGQVAFRLSKRDGLDTLSSHLPKLGFVRKLDRVEYKKAIDQLPSDEGSPINWRTAKELNWTEQQIADVLLLVAGGDPETDPTDDPIKYIQDFLVDPVLTAGLDCIHIGFIDDKIAAMTVVQTNPKSGWSRISYMGVAPVFRSMGLGKWVHRYGFVQIKKQGGTLYHGGTSTANKSMMRLFEMHGCDLFREMEEWSCKLNGGQQ